ncbi:MAG: 2-C-methyl-D-erythritol 4-phosphate cytidylyltransferase, partial [Deltaproteobacteria bacterium]|nr:2-C-methyl-D-erythritol 4-phosphate cytidylyltransferase [Deltaproteobacteria bacterium]
MKFGAVIVGGGQGSRLKADVPKAFVPVGSKPLFWYSLEAFLSHPDISEIVLVLPKERPDVSIPNRCKIITGGSSRQDSVFNGLNALSPDCDAVLVHDAARPFITRDIIDRLVAKLKEGKGCIAAWPVSDTVKLTEGEHIVKTIDRTHLWAAQTPQAFPT